MKTPLYTKLNEYINLDIKRFCMPSHSGEAILPLYDSAKYDFTELSFTDNLHNETGIIKEAEELLSKSYNSEDSFIFTTGATQAIMTAVRVIGEFADEVLVDSFSHKSVFSSFGLFDIKAHLLKREYDSEGFPKKVDISLLKRELEKNQNIKAVIITSPDYFGRVSDMEEILKVVKEYNAILMIDEAQGAHFTFSKLFPKSMAGYADIVIDSMHKTLPVYGGGAVLNCKRKYSDFVRHFRSLLSTSSPSYVTMASIDFARGYFDEKGEELYNKMEEKIIKFKEGLGDRVRFSDDFTRLVVKCDGDYLEKKGIYMEMQWGEYGVFILNPFNIKHLENLKEEILNSPSGKKLNGNELNNLFLPSVLVPDKRKREFIDIDKSVGRISGAYVGCYPPGVPILFEGEKITKEKIDFLKGKNTFNLAYDKICVIMEKSEGR